MFLEVSRAMLKGGVRERKAGLSHEIEQRGVALGLRYRA